jgi:hypothetical protein
MGDSVRPLGNLVRSEEFRRFVLESPAMQATAFPLYMKLRNSPRFGAQLERIRSGTRSSNVTALPYDRTWIEMQLSEAALSCEAATQQLGYTPQVSFADGLERVARWGQAFGQIPRLA